jgi:hypothetical protein
MIQKISKSDELKSKLASDDKTSYLENPEDLKAILAMDKQAELVRRDYKNKELNSTISAARVVLTA